MTAFDERAYRRDVLAPRYEALLRAANQDEKRRIWAGMSDEMRGVLKTMARATDPATSTDAAQRVVASGQRADHMARIVAAVKAMPGHTSAELAKQTGLERHEAARRASDAKNAGLVRQGHSRTCTISHRSAVTWWTA